MKIAVYPGSLDPITFGHVDAIADAAAAFDKVVVAIGINPSKNYMFALAEREALARRALAGMRNVSVTSFSGLLVKYLVRSGLKIVVRGLRNGQDFSDSHLQETIGWQQDLANGIRAFYIPARAGQTFTSSTALKGVLKEQGDASALAPLSTIHATQARLRGQYLYGITGASGAGKSTLCAHFADIAKRRGIALTHMDLDKVAHGILDHESEALYVKARAQIVQHFGDEVREPGGKINRKKLGQIVFRDPNAMRTLNSLMHGPIFFRANDMLYGRSGLFLIDAALLAEAGKTPLVHNNVMLVRADEKDLAQRLAARDGLSAEQVERRMRSQYTAAHKEATIRAQQQSSHYGALQCVDSKDGLTQAAIERAFDSMLASVDVFGELRITGFLRTLGIAQPGAAYHAIRNLYAGDDRFYHALSHIVDGLNLLPDFVGGLDDPDAFRLAWFFHDASYDTHRNDNEESSAALMAAMASDWGLPSPMIERAKRLIMVTKHGQIKAQSNDEKLMVDLDMSILGRDAQTYNAYEQAVRKEYGWVPEDQWRKGRGAFLASLKAPLFHTKPFLGRYGSKAWQNVRRAAKRLHGPGG